MWFWWEARNYDIFLPNRVAHDALKLSLDRFIDAHFYPQPTTNYFVIPNERRMEIRDRAKFWLPKIGVQLCLHQNRQRNCVVRGFRHQHAGDRHHKKG